MYIFSIYTFNSPNLRCAQREIFAERNPTRPGNPQHNRTSTNGGKFSKRVLLY